MSVFRIEKTQNYTVMSNHHLRNAALSLKAKGLLSQMLSLPDTWDYTLSGLAHINREKVDAIREAVRELENAGYITRSRLRDEKGHLRGTEYVIHEQPQENQAAETTENAALSPALDYPTLGNPTLENPTLENPTQLNIDVRNKEVLNTDLSYTNQSTDPAQGQPSGMVDMIDRITAREVYSDIIKGNIEYDFLCLDHSTERVAEILELLLDAVCSARKHIRIGGEERPAESVKQRFMKLGRFHIEYVLDSFSKNTTKIHNIKAYLLTALYNAPTTMNNYYAAEVNHDQCGG